MPELTQLRGENSKTYTLEDGKYRLESHIGAIHYRDNYADPSESWKDIDLTWENDRIIKAPYELIRDGNKFTFRDKKTGEVSTIERISVFPLGIGLEVIPELSAVRFRHTLPSSNIPFEAQFVITGNQPITRAFDDEGELELETTLVNGVLTEKLSQVKDKQTGQVRPAKGQIRVDPTWEILVSSDDCRRELKDGLWSLTHTLFMAGAAAGNWMYGSGGRFTNITIPQGATIDSAYLTLEGAQVLTTTGVKTRISAEDVDDAPTFADDAAAFDARWAARTTARVDWDNIASWTTNTLYNSPEIRTVIQEVIDRAGWVSGNDIVIFWEDFDDRSPHIYEGYRAANSADGGDPHEQLVVTYTAGSPRVTTQAVTAIAGTTATGNGNITALGGTPVTQHGHCWVNEVTYDNGNHPPTTADSKTTKGNGLVGAFTSSITGLTPGTLYYVRAYATNTSGTSYGSQVTFTALSTPTVTTQAVKDIVTTTATGRGNITNIGSSAVTQHGHCWVNEVTYDNGNHPPTTADSKTTNGAGSAGAFTSAITGLTEETKYYVRSYATNAAGTSYGAEVVFWAGLGTVYSIDPLSRVSRIRWVFDAFPGKVPDYYMEIFLGGATTAYVPAIGSVKPTPAIPPPVVTKGPIIFPPLRTGITEEDIASEERALPVTEATAKELATRLVASFKRYSQIYKDIASEEPAPAIPPAVKPKIVTKGSVISPSRRTGITEQDF